MGAIIMIPVKQKPILATLNTAFVPKGNRQAGSTELDYRGLIFNPVSRTSKSLEMFGLSTDFPTTDLGSWASGDA